MAWRGKYRPRNPEKYVGNIENITYRSSWECRVMSYLDKTPGVLAWASEEVVIPYFDPVQNRKRRYFPDFYVKLKLRDGTICEHIWEVKPLAQTKEPVNKKSKPNKRFIREVYTFGTNQAKWAAAEDYCALRGWKFLKLTEENIFGQKKKKPHK